MLRRVLAIFFILIANMSLLAHSMIEHHHHNENAISAEYSTVTESSDEHTHIDNYLDTPHSSDFEDHALLENRHEHDLPQHCHLSSIPDIYIVQLEQSKSLIQLHQAISIILFGFTSDEPCEISLKKLVHGDFEFQISSLYKPGPAVLRGPPIA